MGIDKTLKLIRESQRPLLEVEHLLRIWWFSRDDSEGSGPDRGAIPYLEIEQSPFDESEMEDEWDIYLALDEIHEAMETNAKKQRRKGGSRRPLGSWTLSPIDIEKITEGFRGYERNRFHRLRAECRILSDALKVISGRITKIPGKYPKDIESKLRVRDRSKVASIIEASLAISHLRIQKAEADLSKSRKKLIELSEDVEWHEERLARVKKKWGGVSRQ